MRDAQACPGLKLRTGDTFHAAMATGAYAYRLSICGEPQKSALTEGAADALTVMKGTPPPPPAHAGNY